MISYTDVQTKLTNSDWPESAKASLLPVLPQMGQRTLGYLFRSLSATASSFTADRIAAIIANEVQWYIDIQTNDTAGMSAEINRIFSGGDDDELRALLAIVLDIRLNKAINILVPQALSDQFDSLEIVMLRSVPPSEVAAMLTYRTLNLATIFDAQMEIKRYCYYRDIEPGDPEIAQFKTALDICEVTLGSVKIAASKGPVEPQLKNWFKDFLQFGASVGMPSTYSVVYYVTNASQVNILSTTDKELLSDILKLYSWLVQPGPVSEEEIEVYEKSRENYLASLAQPQALVMPKPGVSDDIIPKPKPSKSSKYYSLHGRPEDSAPAAPPHPPTPEPIPPRPTHGGLAISQGTNVDVEEEERNVAAKRKLAVASIQKKLAELRNKTK